MNGYVISLIFPGFILLSCYTTPFPGGRSKFFLAELGMKGAVVFLASALRYWRGNACSMNTPKPTVLDPTVMTWLYNRTNGSLLAPALFHPVMNTFGNNFLITPLGNILFVGLAIYAIVSDRMWKKLPSDHPAVYQQPLSDNHRFVHHPGLVLEG